MARIESVEYDPSMSINSNIPAKLIVNDKVYDVMIDSVTTECSKYDYGKSNYWDNINRLIIHGEEVMVDTFVCKRYIRKLY